MLTQKVINKYYNSLLSGSSRKSLKTLQLVQNAAARVLTRTKKREHITPVLASLHWLPVKSRIEFKILLLTFKSLNNMAPLYLKELIVPYQPTRALRSQNSSLLVVPKVSKSRVGARAFSQSFQVTGHSELLFPASPSSSPSLSYQRNSYLINTRY